MSVNTSSSLGDASSVASLPPHGHRGEVVKTGNLKKLKTNKKKYFVLRCESADYPARLEYYDSEKKFKAHQQPKRSISLKACFNINRRTDMKPKYVIALYTKDDCFCIVLESEEEREAWLKALWALQDGDDVTDGEAPKPVFEHVWKVEVANKGLGATRGLSGSYHLCLTGRTVSLVNILSDGSKDILEFPLTSIRSFGCAESFFYMEVGRNAVTGTGEIWMLAEDAVIAKDMSRAINAMRSRGDDRIRSDDSGSRQIARSASVSEPTRPVSVSNRRHNNSASEKHDERESLVPNANESSTGYVGNLDTYCEMRVPGRLVTSDHGSSAGRDRSDSLPSTVRAPTDNHPFSHGSIGTHNHYPHHMYGRTMHYIPACHRPHSMYNRGISNSPPVNNSSPVSPASGACSTDSAGSSLSIDDGENWVDGTDGTLSSSISSRYPTNHPLTPESPIEEENCDDYVHWNGPSGLDSGVGDDEKMNNYMPMAPSAATLSLPIQQPHSGAARKFSPGRSAQGAILKTGTSPSHSNYMEMNSPCGSSPMDTPANYMIMSPGNAPDSVRNAAFHNRNFQHTAPSSANHSRTSSLAEETPDGYVPMMPGQTDDGYVDMDPQSVDVHDDFHHGEMSPSSSCSITSGTPSTDLRFSEYPLEKVNSYLTPSEEEEHSEQRPARCYSVGSKPESLIKKNRIDFINQADCSRVRAFSVGSRNAPGSKYMSRPLGHDIHATRHALQAGGHFTPPSQQRHQQGGGGKKSSSAPILSNPLSSSPMNRQILGGSHSSVEPMDDLMEMDFSPSVSGSSKNNRNKNAGKSGGRSKSTCVNEYVSMSPADRLSVPAGGGGPSHHSSLSSVASSYSTADGVDVVDHVGSPRTFDSMGPGSPPKTSILRGVYSNSVGRSPPDSVARSPPNRSNVLPRSAVARMSCISELKPQNFPMTTPSPPIKPSLLATNNSATSMAAKMAKMAVSSPYVEMNPSNATMKPVMATSNASKQPAESGPYVEMKGRTSSGTPVAISKPTGNVLPSSATNEDYLDMSFKPRRTSVPECKDLSNAAVADGYVEMGWKASGESDLDSNPCKISLEKPMGNEDYMVMTGGGSSSRNRRERRGSTKRERNQFRSQPINIQQPQHNRKIVMDTPPKAPPSFLPLGSSLDSQSPLSSPFASLSRSRNRKGSKDSSSNTSGVTTPSGSSSTIFPISLNSPCSPLAPFSEDDTAVTSASVSEASFDKLEKVPADMSSGTLRLSYPNFETSKSNSITSANTKQDLPKHDYVNFTPNSSECIDSSLKSSILDDTGDYAVMCPGSSVASKTEPQKKAPTSTVCTNNKPIARLPIDDELALSAKPQSSDFSRSSSKPLTVSSLLGMNNLSPSSSPSEPLNSLSSSTASTSKLLQSRQVTPASSVSERKVQNCDSDSSSISSCGTLEKASSSSSISRQEIKDGSENVVDLDASSAGPVTPVVYSSPNTSPCPSPSPCSEGSSSHVSPVSPSLANAGGAGVREKKMSSGSDSSTASRDSQLLVRKHSTGSVSPTGSGTKNKGSGANGKSNTTPANRRLSCPSKSSVSRQVSLSSDVSDTSQLEESRLSEFGSSLSRQTSSSSASGEASSSSTLALTEKRSLSCSPVPSSASPVPRPAEREINYASLDLRTGSESEDSSTRSPRGLKSQGSLSESQSSTSSPSPNPPGGTFTYAQIDFEKSEELWSASTSKGVKQ